MRALEFKAQHYPIVVSWWQAHGWPVLTRQMLSKVGVIVYSGESPVCAAWLYTTDSQLSLLEWTVSDPKSEPKVRDEALDLLFKSLLSRARGKIVCTFSAKSRLTERFEALGFTRGDEKMDFLIKGVPK